MPDDELLERVRELRARGRSPKEIARPLKVRPATVTPLIRRLAAAGPQEKEAPGSSAPSAATCPPLPGMGLGFFDALVMLTEGRPWMPAPA